MLRPLLVVLAGIACASCDVPQRPPVAPVPSARPAIWHLVSRDHVISAHVGANGPTYTVTTRGGEVLVASATLEELKMRDPALHRYLESALAFGVWARQ